MTTDDGPPVDEQDLRDRAIRRIKKKRDLQKNTLVFVLVNAGLWAFWAYDGADTSDLWPAVVTGIWGILLAVDAWKAYGERPISEQDIQAELSRFDGR
jgi:hypothetical protein